MLLKRTLNSSNDRALIDGVKTSAIETGSLTYLVGSVAQTVSFGVRFRWSCDATAFAEANLTRGGMDAKGWPAEPKPAEQAKAGGPG